MRIAPQIRVIFLQKWVNYIKVLTIHICICFATYTVGDVIAYVPHEVRIYDNVDIQQVSISFKGFCFYICYPLIIQHLLNVGFLYQILFRC